MAIDRTVAARWTPDIARLGWTPISDFFLDNYSTLAPSISNNEAMFIAHLMRHKWDEGMPYPGSKSLAKKMRVSATCVRGYARSLEVKGYLRRLTRVGTTNHYDLRPLFDHLEKHHAYLAGVKDGRRQTTGRTPITESMKQAAAQLQAVGA